MANPPGEASTRTMDPGVVGVLRLCTGVLWLVVASTAVAFLQHQAPEHAPAAMWSMLALTSLALALLFWPGFRRPSRWALPAVLLLLAAVPFAGQLMALWDGPLAYQKIALEFSLVLFVPVLVCAWQYGLKPALLLGGVAAALDFALSLLVHASPSWAEVHRHILASATVAMWAAVYITVRLVGELRRQRDSLVQANAKLGSYALTLERLTISRERNRLARELHDTLAHTLSALIVQLEATRALWASDAAQARTMLDGSLRTARDGMGETRRALVALRASPLDETGLVLALRALAEQAAQRSGVAVDIDLPDDAPALPRTVEEGVYRIAQEALENLARHAEARHARVALTSSEAKLELTITDDGRGFDMTSLPPASFGIRGMRERAHMLGGQLHVHSTPGQGTTVRLGLGISTLASEDGP